MESNSRNASKGTSTGTYEVTRNGSLGMFYEVGDVEQLAGHLMQTISEYDKAASDAISGAQYIRERFSVTTSCRELTELLFQTAKSRR